MVEFGGWEGGCGDGGGGLQSVFHGTARTACVTLNQRSNKSD